jgi:cytochrome c biogenesis protein CcmG, thiol:disulfide interchange protein DsbE
MLAKISFVPRWFRKTCRDSVAIAAGLFFAVPAWALDVNATAPAFSLQGTSAVVSLEQFRGQLVYLDFWASWCAPCKRSFPFMNALQRKYASRGLRVVAISVDQVTDDARRFLQAVPAEFTIAFDPLGVSPKLYKVMGMPSSVLIGRDGQILFVHQGFRHADEARLERVILDALDSGA